MILKLLCSEEDGFVGVAKVEHKQIKLFMHKEVIDFIQKYSFLVIINRFFAIKNRYKAQYSIGN